VPDVVWDIRPEGHSWRGDEASARFALAPEKLELIEGRLLWSDEERLMLLGLLLENVGTRAAVKLGDLDAWRAAVRDFSDEDRSSE
jgi:hypothetical protein